jgi:hypothetical protein
MVALLDFAPAAWQAYQGLPAGELSSQVREALQRLAADPAAVRAGPASCRYQIIEERLPQGAQVWGCRWMRQEATAGWWSGVR